MGRTLVSIISAQAVPNYVFIKDFLNEGDKLLFFTSSSPNMNKSLDYILSTLNISKDDVTVKPLSEESWPQMCKEIETTIEPGGEYLVNTTGGTKYMSMAVSEIFEKHGNASFLYIPYPKNVYLKTNGEEIPIKHRVSIKEYMGITKGVEYSVKKCTQERDYVFRLFGYYQEMTREELEILEKIRTNFRAQKCTIDDVAEVSNGATHKITNAGKSKEKRYDFEQIENLDNFLKKIEFPCKTENKLSKEEIEFLTGGWYEEYMYYLIEEKIEPDDIELGVFIKQSINTNTNDLDVVFTKGNKLYVIECKTAISGTAYMGEESMFKEISYKAATLKATLLGLPSNSYICSLSESDERFKSIAKNMGIIYYDRSYFTEPAKLDNFLKDIIKQAY